jgi:hypothetical protein
LYDLVAIAKDGSDFAVFYVYANLAGNTINDIWYESYDTEIDYEYASGSANCTAVSSTISVSLPGINVEPTAITTNVKINGDNLFFSYNFGWVFYGNQNFTITPWSYVDCSSCGNGG